MDLEGLIAQSANQPTRLKQYELRGRSPILYREDLGRTARFNYRMKARLAVRAQVRAYPSDPCLSVPHLIDDRPRMTRMLRIATDFLKNI